VGGLLRHHVRAMAEADDDQLPISAIARQSETEPAEHTEEDTGAVPPTSRGLSPFLPAGRMLGDQTMVRTITLAAGSRLPAGDYTLIDCFCSDPACDCRRSIIQVFHDDRCVSMVAVGWETEAFYEAWCGQGPLDAQTLSELKGPAITMDSPDLVDPEAMLHCFRTLILDSAYFGVLKQHYRQIRQAL